MLHNETLRLIFLNSDYSYLWKLASPSNAAIILVLASAKYIEATTCQTVFFFLCFLSFNHRDNQKIIKRFINFAHFPPFLGISYKDENSVEKTKSFHTSIKEMLV